MKVCIHSPQKLVAQALALMLQAYGHETVPDADATAEIALWDLTATPLPYPFPPPMPTLAIITGNDNEAMHALKRRYRGSLQASDGVDVLQRALLAVRRGEIWADRRLLTRLLDSSPQPKLTQRERETLELILKGFSNRKIAEALRISVGTVKMHVSHILEKRGVSSRNELMALALESKRAERRPPDPRRQPERRT